MFHGFYVSWIVKLGFKSHDWRDSSNNAIGLYIQKVAEIMGGKRGRVILRRAINKAKKSKQKLHPLWYRTKKEHVVQH
jgi:hypothetical protein